MSETHHFEAYESTDDIVIGNKNKKRLLKKAPDAPKRFKSAYICYVMEKMDETKSEHAGDIKVGDRVETNIIFRDIRDSMLDVAS